MALLDLHAPGGTGSNWLPLYTVKAEAKHYYGVAVVHVYLTARPNSATASGERFAGVSC